MWNKSFTMFWYPGTDSSLRWKVANKFNSSYTVRRLLINIINRCSFTEECSYEIRFNKIKYVIKALKVAQYKDKQQHK